MVAGAHRRIGSHFNRCQCRTLSAAARRQQRPQFKRNTHKRFGLAASNRASP